MRFFAYGLMIDSELELPLSRVDDGGAPDVRVRSGDVTSKGVAFSPVLGFDDDVAWLERGWAAGRVLLRFQDLVAELRPGDPVITISAQHEADLQHLGHLVLDHVIPRWCALKGETVLHAGAVVTPDGSAVVFLGDTGQGKSTMTTALGLAGWPVLGDDACRLIRDEAGWAVVPGYPGVRLTSRSREALTPGLASTPMSEGADKHRVLPDVHAARSVHRLGLVLELGDDTALRAKRLSLSEATAVLTRHSFHLASRPDAVASQAFRLSSALALDVACHRVDFPRRWDVFSEMMALIDDLQTERVP